MTQRNQLKAIVTELIEKKARRDTKLGDTQEVLRFVAKHDGRLAEFMDELWHIALETVIRDILRKKRLPHSLDLPAYPSVDIGTGEYDDEGNEYVQTTFVEFAAAVQEKDVELCNRVVDSYIRRSNANARIANNLVKFLRATIKGYQRPLPFPELEDEAESA